MDTSHMKVNKHIIHNFLSCVLSPEDITALSFELDRHIPDKVDNNPLNTEFELFYQTLLQDNFHLPEHTLLRIKIKFPYTCDKCCNTKRPYEYEKVIQNLKGNQSILILKQDKRREVVIRNLNTCAENAFRFSTRVNSSNLIMIPPTNQNKNYNKLLKS